MHETVNGLLQTTNSFVESLTQDNACPFSILTLLNVYSFRVSSLKNTDTCMAQHMY